jgi:hypothetical protein
MKGGSVIWRVVVDDQDRERDKGEKPECSRVVAATTTVTDSSSTQISRSLLSTNIKLNIKYFSTLNSQNTSELNATKKKWSHVMDRVKHSLRP